MITLVVLVVLFVLLQWADIKTTDIFLRLGVVEGNPAVRWFMRQLGSDWWTAKAIVALGIIGATIIFLPLRQAQIVIGILNVPFVGVVVWNLYWIRRAKKAKGR